MKNNIRFPIFVVYKKYDHPIPLEFFSTLDRARDYLRWAEFPLHEKRMDLKNSLYYIGIIKMKDIDAMSDYVDEDLKYKRSKHGN